MLKLIGTSYFHVFSKLFLNQLNTRIREHRILISNCKCYVDWRGRINNVNVDVDHMVHIDWCLDYNAMVIHFLSC